MVGKIMKVNTKNLHYQSKLESKDSAVKQKITDTFKNHPAYGHRRLALELKMNRKKIRRIMKKYGLTPPRLWYQKKYLTRQNKKYQDQFENLIKDVNNPGINEIWSGDLTYLKFKDRFLYLSAIQDLVSNEVLACNLSDKHEVIRDVKMKLPQEFSSPPIFFACGDSLKEPFIR